MRSLILVSVFLCSVTFAGEVEETMRLAPKYEAKAEVVLWDMTRVDLLNDEYAIEVEWPKKWAEAIGQSLYYSIVTNKKPAIILLIKDKKSESRYIYRLQTVAAKHGIKVYLEEVSDE
jgi:hypothetical protein